MHLKMSSAKWRPFCPDDDELEIAVPSGLLVSMHVFTEYNDYICIFQTYILIHNKRFMFDSNTNPTVYR